MGTITSAICSSFKAEEAQAAHCFTLGGTFTGSMANASQTVTSVSSAVGLSVGMPVSATNLTAGAVVESIVSSSSITLSRAATALITGGTFTFSGDTFKIALIKATPTNNFGAANVNYSDLGADEVTGTGYTAGGLALTNVTPALASTTAWWTFNNAPATTWTGANISMGGAMIYNSGTRLGGTSGTNTSGAGRAVAVFNTGTQTVTSGTLTITYPQTANGLLSVT